MKFRGPELMILPPQSKRSQEIARARQTKSGLYADTPGTGPAGETCRTCRHMVRKLLARVYRKCGLCRRHWTGGGATDVKAMSPACSKWEKAE